MNTLSPAVSPTPVPLDTSGRNSTSTRVDNTKTPQRVMTGDELQLIATANIPTQVSGDNTEQIVKSVIASFDFTNDKRVNEINAELQQYASQYSAIGENKVPQTVSDKVSALEKEKTTLLKAKVGTAWPQFDSKINELVEKNDLDGIEAFFKKIKSQDSPNNRSAISAMLAKIANAVNQSDKKGLKKATTVFSLHFAKEWNQLPEDLSVDTVDILTKDISINDGMGKGGYWYLSAGIELASWASFFSWPDKFNKLSKALLTLGTKSGSISELGSVFNDPGKVWNSIYHGKSMAKVAEDLTKSDSNWAKAGELAEIGGAVAAGAAIGTFFGPGLGTAAGGLIGGIVGVGAGLINHWMDSTERGEGMFFGLVPPDQTVANIEDYLDDLAGIFTNQSGKVFQNIINGTSVQPSPSTIPSATPSNSSTSGNQDYGNVDDSLRKTFGQ